MTNYPTMPVDGRAKKHIVILGTGGTIAGTGEPGRTTGYTAGTLELQTLIDGVPGLTGLARLTGEQLINADSDNITARDWLTLVGRINALTHDDVDGFVVTHGTDTLEETAFFLHLAAKTHKPVVMVGAMRPYRHQRRRPHEPLSAVALARSDAAKDHGVMVVFSDGIYSARMSPRSTPLRPMPLAVGISVAWAICGRYPLFLS